MKNLLTLTLVFFVASLTSAHATALKPTLDLEKQIAYQQGRFGALYALCGSTDDKIVIGGDLVTWKEETFRGYQGSQAERTTLDQAFDNAVHNIQVDSSACQDWIKQAAAAWKDIQALSRYGM